MLGKDMLVNNISSNDRYKALLLQKLEQIGEEELHSQNIVDVKSLRLNNFRAPTK